MLKKKISQSLHLNLIEFRRRQESITMARKIHKINFLIAGDEQVSQLYGVIHISGLHHHFYFDTEDVADNPSSLVQNVFD